MKMPWMLLLLAFGAVLAGCDSNTSSRSYEAAIQAERERRAAEAWYELEMQKLETLDEVNRMGNDAFESPSFD